jgi:hypothetical protein
MFADWKLAPANGPIRPALSFSHASSGVLTIVLKAVIDC